MNTDKEGKEAGAGQLQLTAFKLTVVAVLPRPTRHALAEVSTNQVAARVGIDTGLAIAFVGIWGGRERVCGICTCS